MAEPWLETPDAPAWFTTPDAPDPLVDQYEDFYRLVASGRADEGEYERVRKLRPQQIAAANRERYAKEVQNRTKDWSPAAKNAMAVFTGMGQSVLPPLVRPFNSEAADRFNRIAGVWSQLAEEQDSQNKVIPSWLSRGARGAATQLPSTIVNAQLGGPAAAIAGAAVSEADQSYTQALDAGRTADESARYAIEQGIAEGGIAGAFQLAGLGGLESAVAGKGTGLAVRNIVKELGAELTEEEATSLVQAVQSKLAGVEPDALKPENLQRTVFDTAVQTLVTMGLAKSPDLANAAIDRFQPSSQPTPRGPDFDAVQAAYQAAQPPPAPQRSIPPDVFQRQSGPPAPVPSTDNLSYVQELAARAVAAYQASLPPPAPQSSIPPDVFQRQSGPPAPVPSTDNLSYEPEYPLGPNRSAEMVHAGMQPPAPEPGDRFSPRVQELAARAEAGLPLFEEQAAPVLGEPMANPPLRRWLAERREQRRLFGPQPEPPDATGLPTLPDQPPGPAPPSGPPSALYDTVEGNTPKPSGFTTAQGSRYSIDDQGRTTRTKSKHLGHDPKDVGEKRPSERTFYVDPEDARRVGMWQTSSAKGKRIVVQGDEAILVSINPKTGKHGSDERIKLQTQPAIGLSPLELWNPNEQGWWRENHPGSPITEITETPTLSTPRLDLEQAPPRRNPFQPQEKPQAPAVEPAPPKRNPFQPVDKPADTSAQVPAPSLGPSAQPPSQSNTEPAGDITPDFTYDSGNKPSLNLQAEILEAAPVETATDQAMPEDLAAGQGKLRRTMLKVRLPNGSTETVIGPGGMPDGLVGQSLEIGVSEDISGRLVAETIGPRKKLLGDKKTIAPPTPTDTMMPEAEDAQSNREPVVAPEPGVQDGAGELGAEPPAIPGEPAAGGDAGPGVAATGEVPLPNPGKAQGLGRPRGPGKRDSGQRAPAVGEPELAGGGATEPAGAKPAAKVPENLRNHRIAADDSLAVSSEKESLRRNVGAVKLLKELEAEGRQATPDEKRMLAQYTGWGGLSQVFDNTKGSAMTGERPSYYRDEAWEKKWGSGYKDLRSLLSPEEWEAARDSTINAHYTSKPIIQKMWQMVEQLGFKGGRVLEPGAGIGHFAGLVPDSLRNSQFVMVEKDALSSKLLQKLYPDADVHATAMEEFRIAPGSVDLVIGNVPFAKDSHMDDAERRYGISLNLHNYFIARSLDAVRPGGVVAVISTHNTLDSSQEQRKLLAKKGNLIGAIRLPNNAFAENAKTEVVTDILVFQKPAEENQTGEPFELTKPLDHLPGQPRINEYFHAHPEMVLGEHSTTGSMYRKNEYTVDPSGSLHDKLSDAIGRLPKLIYGGEQAQGEVVSVDQGDATREGSLKLIRDQPFMATGGKWVGLDDQVEGYRKNLFTAGGRARAKQYIELRDAFREVRQAMLDPAASESAIKSAQQKMGKIYDAYVKAHGNLHGIKTSIFENDPEYYRVLSLADVKSSYNPTTNKLESTHSKAPIFTKRTLGPRLPPASVENAKDGVSVSLSYRGKLDIDYISQLSGKSPEQVATELSDAGLAFRDPLSQKWETKERYLSGNVRKKLRDAELAAQEDDHYHSNVAALKAVQPARVGLAKIHFALGSNWISPGIVQSFARKLFDNRYASVRYDKVNDIWSVDADKHNVKSTETWAGGGRRGDQLLADALNLKTPKITREEPDGYDDRGRAKTKTVIDEKATTAAKAMLARIQKEFKSFVEKNEEHAAEIEETYNTTFNSFVDPKFDGSHLDLPGSNPDIKLRPYQKDAIWRMLQDRFVMLAHAVGAGKTFTMIGAAMEMRRLGLAKRPLLVVQNATLGQFATSFLRMYPNANVLVAGKDDLAADNRQLFLNRVTSGDWDAVVMAQSTFDRLSSHPDIEQQFIHDQLHELEEAIAEEGGERARTASVKDLVRARVALQKRLDKILAAEKENRGKNTVYFDDLHADALFLDEAHAYKKPFFLTKLENLVGLNKQSSARGVSTMMKVRQIQAKNQGRNVFLATGTPITNTLGESWHMMNFVAPHLNQEFGVRTFDGFVGAFAAKDTVREMNAGGKWVFKDALVKFVNGQELMHYLRSAWDILGPDDLRAYMTAAESALPTLKGGKVQAITIPLTPGTEKFMDFLKQVYEKFQKLPGKDKKELSYIPAVAYGAAKAASLDMRLIYPHAKEEMNNKLSAAAEQVFQDYTRHTESKGAQLVFSDTFNSRNMDALNAFMRGELVSTGLEMTETAEEGGESFLFNELRKKLIAKGVKPSEIAMISDAKTDAQREALFERVKSGDIRVLMGSSQKMGVGVNVQNKLTSLHHLDAPWLPADIEQREGRIVRFGNENREVSLYRYAMKNTLDAAIFSKTVRKGKFIWQVLSGREGGREFDDPASELTMSIEEQLAAIQDDPLFFEKMDVERKRKDLELEKEAHFDAVARARDNIRWGKENLERLLTRSIPENEARLAEVKAVDTSKPVAKIGGRNLTDLKDINEAVAILVKKNESSVLEKTKGGKVKQSAYARRGIRETDGERTAVFDLNGYEVQFNSGAGEFGGEGWRTDTAANIFLPSNKKISLYDGTATTGRGLYDAIRDIPARVGNAIAQLKGQAEKQKADIAELEQIVRKPWDHQTELDGLVSRSEQIEQELVNRDKSKDQPTPPLTGQDDRLGLVPFRKFGVKPMAALQKFLTSRGNLPEEVFKAKLSLDASISEQMTELQFASTALKDALMATEGRTDLTPQGKQTLDDALKGDAAALSSLKPAVKEAVMRMRNHIDALSRRLIDSGLANGDLELTIENNMGIYVTRSYRVFDDPAWPEKVPPDVRNKATAFIRAEMMAFDQSADFHELAKVAASKGLLPTFPPGHPQAGQANSTGETRNSLLTKLRGYRPTDLEVKNKLDTYLYRENAPLAIIAGSKLGSKDLSITRKRQDVPPELRALLGEHTDPLVNYSRSVTKMANLIANHEFLAAVKQAGMGKFFFEEDDLKRPEGHVAKIAADGSGTMAPLNGLMTTPEIKQAFEDVYRRFNPSKFMQLYMRFVLATKYSKTVLSPVATIRNWWGNIAFAVANAHWDLRKMKDAFLATKEDVRGNLPNWARSGLQADSDWQDRLKHYKRLGVVDGSVHGGELREALRDAMEDTPESLEERNAQKAAQWVRQGGKFFEKIYQTMDSQWKIYGFENERSRLKAAYEKAGQPLSDEKLDQRAAEIVRNTLPTYAMVPEAIKALRRAPLIGSFVSFPAEAIRTKFHSIKLAIEELNDPIRAAIGAQRLAGNIAVLALPTALSLAVRFLLGITDDDDEDLRKFLPPWRENSDIVWLSKDPGGKASYIDLSHTMPDSYLRKPFLAMLRGDDVYDSLKDGAWTFAEPFIGEDMLAKRIINIARNRDERDRHIWNPAANDLDRLTATANHLWEALEPGFISQGKRIEKAVTGRIDPSGREYDLGQEVATTMTGFRAETADVATSLSVKATQFAAAAPETTKMFSQVIASRGTATKGEVETAHSKMEEARQKQFNKMHGEVRAAIRLGVSEEEAKQILNSAGISKGEADRLISGSYEPYQIGPGLKSRILSSPQADERLDAETLEQFRVEEATRHFAVVTSSRPLRVTPAEQAKGLTIRAKVEKWEADKDAALRELRSSPLGKERLLKSAREWVVGQVKDQDARRAKLRRIQAALE